MWQLGGTAKSIPSADERLRRENEVGTARRFKKDENPEKEYRDESAWKENRCQIRRYKTRRVYGRWEKWERGVLNVGHFQQGIGPRSANP